MKKTIKLKAMPSIAAMLSMAGIIALVVVIGFSMTACEEEEEVGIPSELVGKWYKYGTLMFEITSAGIFTDEVSNYRYDISVSGNTVELKMNGTKMGSFDYSINNGEMTMTNGTGVGMTYQLLSPLKDSGVPSTLVGKWYTTGFKAISFEDGDFDFYPDSLAFEITSAGKFIRWDGMSYDISASGNTATLKFGGTTVGTFGYSASNGGLTMTNGTGIGTYIVSLSPLIRQQ